MQLVSLGADKTVKVWDLRNQKCLQTMTPKDWTSAEDANPTCLAYDAERQRLVSAVLPLNPGSRVSNPEGCMLALSPQTPQGWCAP